MNSIGYLLKSAMIPAFVIVGIMAVVAAFDKEGRRPAWARNSLLMFAATAFASGILTYLLASRQLGNVVTGSVFKWEGFARSLRSLSFGMFLVLVQSGYLWGRGVSEEKNAS